MLFFGYQITHPAGCFPQFIKFFGEQIFVLWKFVLLQKRILFFAPPPVGVACYRGKDLSYWKNELLGSNPFHFISGIIQQWFPSAVVKWSVCSVQPSDGGWVWEVAKHERSLRVALGYCLVGLLHFFCAWQTSQVHP